MVDVRQQSIASAIEDLLLDDGDLDRIAANLGGFNIFEAIGHTHSEERHSHFLAFLLDPNETHGIGTDFLTRFVVAIVKSIPLESRLLSLSEITLVDFEGCLVLREHHRIDVLCIDEAHRFLLAIENKVDSGEQPGQLRRYRTFLEKRYEDYRRVLVYLTPDTDPPSDEDWVPIGYGDVLSVVERLVRKHRQRLDDAVVISLDHYAHMLRRHIVIDNDLVSTARAVYRKHKVALDFIFEQIPDARSQISDSVTALASNDNRIEVVTPGKAHIRFFPKAWRRIPAFNATPKDQWTGTGHSLLFEIRNMSDSIKMAIVIGPTKDNRYRRDILEFSHRNRRLFQDSNKNLTRKYTRIYSRDMVNPNILEGQPIEDIMSRVESDFLRFMDNEFDEIVDALSSAFTGAVTD